MVQTEGSISVFFPSSSHRTKSSSIRKGPYFYLPISEQILYLNSFVDFITHCKICLHKVCRQLVLLTLFKPKYCMLLSICKENHVRHRHAKETLKHKILSLAKPGKGIDQLPVFEEIQRKGHDSKGHMPRNFRDAATFHVRQRQRRNVPPVSCDRNSLKFVFVLHLDGR